jgi:hypothetical protein
MAGGALPIHDRVSRHTEVRGGPPHTRESRVGKSTPLFKDPPHVRAKKEAAGEEMRIRPTVCGTLCLRTTLQEVNKTDAGKWVIKKFSKYNKALGTAGGIEEVIFET